MYAFVRCTSLTAISVPPENRQYKDVDGVVLSKDGKILIQYPAGNVRTAYTIPAGVTTIGGSAFSGCSRLVSVTIPDSVTMIGRGAFVECGLTSVTLPIGITSIDRGVFGRCSALESITIPENITSIGPLAFFRCSRLKSVTLPEDISAAYGAFSGCDSLDESIRANLRKRFGDDVFDSDGEGP
jgi:hypothetical protein